MKTALVVVLIIACAIPCYGGNNLIFYQLGRDDDAAKVLKGYFEGKGYGVTIYPGESTLEKHVEKVNSINRQAQAVFIAARFLKGEKERVLVASTPGKRLPGGEEGQDLFVSAQDVPVRLAAESKRLADAIALSLQTRPVSMPLFPLLGVDMPGIFLLIEYRPERLKEMFAALEEGLQKYFRRDRKNEK